MSDLAPLDESITLQQLDEDPYPIYQRLRNEAPVLRVKATGRTMLTLSLIHISEPTRPY